MFAPFHLCSSRFHGGDKRIEGSAFTERIVDEFPQLVTKCWWLTATQPGTVIPAFRWLRVFYDRQAILQAKLVGNPANGKTGSIEISEFFPITLVTKSRSGVVLIDLLKKPVEFGDAALIFGKLLPMGLCRFLLPDDGFHLVYFVAASFLVVFL